jgi:hypothetical protein
MLSSMAMGVTCFTPRSQGLLKLLNLRRQRDQNF